MLFGASWPGTGPAERANSTANNIIAVKHLIFIPQAMLLSEKYISLSKNFFVWKNNRQEMILPAFRLGDG